MFAPIWEGWIGKMSSSLLQANPPLGKGEIILSIVNILVK